jgi:hypothetical protein
MSTIPGVATQTNNLQGLVRNLQRHRLCTHNHTYNLDYLKCNLDYVSENLDYVSNDLDTRVSEENRERATKGSREESESLGVQARII